MNFYELNKNSIKEEISRNSYMPEIIHMKEVLNYNGKRRLVAVLDIKDRFITRAMSQIFEKYISPNLSENSYAYRDNFGIVNAIKTAKEYIEKGNTIVCKLDIKNFFDNINHSKLLQCLSNYKIEKTVISLIEKYLKCDIEYELMISQKSKGVIQGNPISPILSNIYLDSLDKKMQNMKINFIRFSDDISIFSNNRQELIDIKNWIEKELKEGYFLEINKDKTNINSVFKTVILGYSFINQNNSIEVLKKKRTKLKNYEYWKESSLKKESGEYHFINEGILRKQDYSILFENSDKKVYIPIENVGAINIYSNVIINNNFFKEMNDKNIIVNFFDKNNIYIGKFLPNNTRKSSITLLKQVSLYNDDKKRLEMAKDIISAGIHNLKSNLKYYERRYNLKINEKIQKIEIQEKSLKNIQKHIELLLIEARIREIYYSCFNYILNNNEFKFTVRTKRPPKDQINCLISFTNTLLYNFIAKEIYKTSLDIRIAYLHSSNNRYESLNLDLADIFKPIIVDRLIFKLVNKKIVNAKIHFEKYNNGVYLNREGKEIIIREFYNKMADTIMIKNTRMSYEVIIRKEIYKLLNAIKNESKFKAFRYY